MIPVVQQFTHSHHIYKLKIPDLPLELCQRWQKLLLLHHQRQRTEKEELVEAIIEVLESNTAKPMLAAEIRRQLP